MSKKILIVDDEADLVDNISARLEYVGYEVDEAMNGREGLGAYIGELYKGEPFDLILLDIRMPGMSGTEVLAAIRHEEKLRGVPLGTGTPIIMLTAVPEPALESFKQGCDDYILKPYDEVILLQKIKAKLDRADLN